VDREAGLVYVPIEDPTDDAYGGGRPGNDLFGDSIVCLDINTGKMKWYYQVTHHPIWDYDMSSPPLVADITVDGKPVKAVAVPSKQANLYMFDRITGKPIWPIVEKPVMQSDVPGEKTSKTQPFPTKPPPYSRQSITDADLVDFTPEIKKAAQDLVKKYYKTDDQMFGPAVVSSPTGGYPTAILDIGGLSGGTNWPGAGFDPETHVAFLPALNAGISMFGLVPLPEGLSDLKYDEGTGGQVFRIGAGPGFGSASDAPKVSGDDQKLAAALAAHPQTSVGPPPPRSVDGLPLVKPPYGTVTAINMDEGAISWQVAHGDTPDEIKNNPALKGLNIPKTGQAGNVGEVITKSLVVLGDPAYSTQPGHPRGAYLRAYDQKTGDQVGAVYMPAPQSGSPMTYSYDGKQYIMVAVSGGNYSGDYLAYALPQGQ
jgi:quinoprotein glucose dehydrogenase